MESENTEYISPCPTCGIVPDVMYNFSWCVLKIQCCGHQIMMGLDDYHDYPGKKNILIGEWNKHCFTLNNHPQ